jgi:subtilisin family serine protease
MEPSGEADALVGGRGPSPLGGAPVALAQGPAEIDGAAQVAAAARQQGTVRVIARLASSQPGQPLSGAEISSAAEAIRSAMRRVGVTKVEEIGRRPLVVLEVNPLQLDELLRTGQVEAIREDVAVPPDLAQSGPIVAAAQADALGADGSNWAIAILDSGSQTNHPFLAGRIVAQACFSSTTSSSTTTCPNGLESQTGPGSGVNCPLSVDGCAHGTHVAGIAAGRRYSGGPTFDGVAPRAGIIPIQVFSSFTGSSCTNFGLSSPCALTYTSDQIEALDHIASLAASIKIAAANMSLGGGLYTSHCDSDVRKPSIDDLRARSASPR